MQMRFYPSSFFPCPCPPCTAAQIGGGGSRRRPDGGYYLLGISGRYESLFEGIPWGGAEVAHITAKRAAAAGLRIAWLEEKEDVDDINAYRRALVTGHLKPLSGCDVVGPPL